MQNIHFFIKYITNYLILTILKYLDNLTKALYNSIYLEHLI